MKKIIKSFKTCEKLGIFRKNKRNASLNSNSGNSIGSNSTTTTVTTAVEPATTKLKHLGGGKSPQVVLNSYKKSSTSGKFSPTTTNELPLLNANISESDKKGSSSKLSAMSTSTPPIMPNHNQFNLCPKLDEVPTIEPLICKRISNERLTSLVFRDDCFVVATQDGFVYSWSRPSKVNLEIL